MGTYAIIIMDLFALFAIPGKYTLSHVIWPLFVVTILGGGIIFLKKKRKPNAYRFKFPKKVMNRMWFGLFLLSIFTNITFFWLEFSTRPDIYKTMLLGLLVCITLHGFGMAITYMRILHKQKNLDL
jgi:hypothetical protein